MPVFVLAALLWLQLQFGALRVLERLPGAVGDVALVAVWVASAALVWTLLTRRSPLPWRALRTPWPTAVLVVLVAVCAVFVYPEVDGRRSTGGGSDADDAVMLVADRLRDGDDPYGADTYLGNPPTTGPGAALWTLPLPTRGAYAAGFVAAVGAVLLLLRRWSGGWSVPSTTALLLASSVPFWEAIAQGNDQLILACLLAILATAANGVPGRTRSLSPGHTIAIALGAGVLATWRAAYLHLPVLLAISLWRTSRRAAIAVGVGGTALAVALHGLLLSRTDGWDAYDAVQQLVVKSDEDLSAAGRAALVLGVLLAGAVVVREALRPRPRADVLVLAGIGGPLATIAVVGALTADDPAGWSEASYLLPTLVLASVVTARWVVESRPS